MQEIIEQAKKLGEMIAAHERTIALKEMEKVLEGDQVARDLLQEYQKQAERMQNLEHSGKPIEVDDKHKMRDLEQKMALNDTLKKITAKQVDFVEMMNKVKTEIDSFIQM